MKTYLNNYINEVASNVCKSDIEILGKIAEFIINTKKTNSRIFTAGNGGSAATASHITNDLLKGCRVGSNTGFAAFSLNDSVPIITCLANDFSYDEVYSIQLETYGQKGDLLIVFSGSGNSRNIVNAVKKAKEMGIVTVGFTGRDGGELKHLCDMLIIAPTKSMEQIEDIHMIYEHALVSYIQEALKELV